jgi:hypothetical protein
LTKESNVVENLRRVVGWLALQFGAERPQTAAHHVQAIWAGVKEIEYLRKENAKLRRYIKKMDK